MQLKFPAIENAHKGLTIPVRGIGGDRILKLPSRQFNALPENEYSMMELARAVGIDVPRVGLRPPARMRLLLTGLIGQLTETSFISELPPFPYF